MKHPNPEMQANQDAALEALPPARREAQAQLFRIGNAAMHYYAATKNFHPSETDWLEWLEGVREPLRSKFRTSAFEACKSQLSFQRYVLEKNDSGMTAFMKENLSPEDFAIYQETAAKVSDL